MKAKLTRRILATLLVIVMLLAILPTAFAGTFPDVPAGSWFEEAVEYCADNGLMSGTDKGFDPTGKVTREQTVQTLYALEGKPEVAYAAKFTDVPDGQWYTSAILWAVDNGITSGTGNGKFGVGVNVTREQVALFLMAYAKLAGKDLSKADDLSRFPDKDTADSWAVDALKWAVAEGFLSGKKVGDETLLAPLDELTRAELAVILANFHKYINAPDEDLTGKTVILHTNDVHGAIAGYANVAALKAEYEAKGASVILADAGDFSQGSTYVSLSKGVNAIDLMNLAGYDVATLGNHEFDYGYDQLAENLDKAFFSPICANILKDGEYVYSPYFLHTDKITVGFVGLDTPEAQTKVNPALIKGLDFLTNDTEPTIWAEAQKTVNTVKEEADVIIGLVHLGVDEASAPYTSYDLLENVEGLDFVIDGHSHTEMEEGKNGEPIQSTGTAFANVGCIVIDNETKAIEDNYLIPITEGSPADPEVTAAAQAIILAVEAEYGEKFAESLVDLNGDKAPNGNRDSETNNGDFITDAMIWCVTEQYPGSITEVPAQNIVAITNGGGIRAWIHKGDVTKNDIFTVLPFGNTVAVVYVTGAELLEALEASTYCTPEAVGGFPQVAGINFTVNTSKAYDANEETYPGSTYYGPATINRVTINDINGQPFDPEAKYAVVTNNFCAAGGDTYYAFAAATSQFDTGYTLDAVVMDYVTDKLEGVIGEEYAQPQGRITIKTEPDAPSDTLYSVVIPDGADMLKYGHIDIDIPADEFLKTFSLGDTVTVELEGYGSFNVPVCASYDDVAAGEMLLRVVSGKSYIILAINYGQIAVEQGIVEKAPEGAETAYTVKDGVTFPINVTIKPPKTSFESVVIPDGADMLKYGHIDIDIPADEFLKVFSLGDTVTVTLDGYGSFDVPVCASYDDVAAGEMLLRVVSGKSYIILAINYGQIAVEQGIVEKAPEGAETAYVVKDGVSFPIGVTITKKITQVKSVVIPDGADMLKYGHIDIDYPADDFLTEFELGDIVTVELEGYGTYEVPVCASYDDVAAGEPLLRVVSGKTYLILAINYGQIAVQEGLVEKAEEGAATAYVVKEGVTFPINVTITLKEKGSSGNTLGDLIRTDVRADYPALSDAQFANFRKITTTGIKDGILYRSSSPINPEIGRNLYADAAAAEAGVKTFINLADTEAEATNYPDYATSYYSAQNHIFLGLPVAFTTDTFKNGLASGFRYIIANEGPYLVHCTEGKDRAGLTSAILECLMGASYDEIIDDYVETYRNYYSVENGAQRALTEKEEEAAAKVILANLKLSFGVEITETTDLAAAAETYMKSIGLTDEEIAALKVRLGGAAPVSGLPEYGDCIVIYNPASGTIIGFDEATDMDEETYEYTYWGYSTEAAEVDGKTLKADYYNAGLWYFIENDDGTVSFLDEYYYDQYEYEYFLTAEDGEAFAYYFDAGAEFEPIAVDGGYLLKCADGTYLAVDDNGIVFPLEYAEGDARFVFRFAVFEDFDEDDNILCTILG